MAVANPTITTIHANLQTAIGVDHSALATPGTYDLSGAGRVAYGRRETPQGLPFVTLHPPEVETSEEGPPLGYYLFTARIGFTGWAPITLNDPGEQTVSAWDLAADIANACQRAHRTASGSLYSTLRNLSVDITETGSVAEAGSRYARVDGVITVTWAEQWGM